MSAPKKNFILDESGMTQDQKRKKIRETQDLLAASKKNGSKEMTEADKEALIEKLGGVESLEMIEDQVSFAEIDQEELDRQAKEFINTDWSHLYTKRRFSLNNILIKCFVYNGKVGTTEAKEQRSHFNKDPNRPPSFLFENREESTRLYPIAVVLAVGNTNPENLKQGDIVELEDNIGGYETNPKYIEHLRDNSSDPTGGIVSATNAPRKTVRVVERYSRHKFKLNKLRDEIDESILLVPGDFIVAENTEEYKEWASKA